MDVVPNRHRIATTLLLGTAQPWQKITMPTTAPLTDESECTI